MIGVCVADGDDSVAAEFFELFKTPWELARTDRQYQVLLCQGVPPPDCKAAVVVQYGCFDVPGAQCPAVGTEAALLTQSFGDRHFPIYGQRVVFDGAPACQLVDKQTRKAMVVTRKTAGVVEIVVGYELFTEIRYLLTQGQPAAWATVPTLELHIEVLRGLIVGAGVSLVEIPAVPLGYSLTACLSHDVDHPVFRNHLTDKTLLGFVYRATIGSLKNVFTDRLGVRELLANLGEILRLPLVFLNLGGDIWRNSLRKYLAVEAGFGSTFFLIPFRGCPGKTESGIAPHLRAAGYSPSDVADELAELAKAGCEVGLHGIDAWCDQKAARQEREEVEKHHVGEMHGVRMHWLYFNSTSHKILEQAGFAYDSTVGYNDAVGFRAGTAQAYRPLGVDQLIEVPLVIMDTALFYPGRLNLNRTQARKRVLELTNEVARFGGTLTINWHDRSLAAERHWRSFYQDLLAYLDARSTWFPTGSQLVCWYRKRRKTQLEELSSAPGRLRLRAKIADEPGPGLFLRIHRPGIGEAKSQYEDMPLTAGEFELEA